MTKHHESKRPNQKQLITFSVALLAAIGVFAIATQTNNFGSIFAQVLPQKQKCTMNYCAFDIFPLVGNKALSFNNYTGNSNHPLNKRLNELKSQGYNTVIVRDKDLLLLPWTNDKDLEKRVGTLGRVLHTQGFKVAFEATPTFGKGVIPFGEKGLIENKSDPADGLYAGDETDEKGGNRRKYTDLTKHKQFEEIWTLQLQKIKSLLNPSIILLGHDEIRYLPEQHRKDGGKVLSDNAELAARTVRKVIPGATIWVWSGMFSPYESALPEYFSSGDLRGSWAWMDKPEYQDVAVFNWSEKTQSFEWFAGKVPTPSTYTVPTKVAPDYEKEVAGGTQLPPMKAHAQVIAGYYDKSVDLDESLKLYNEHLTIGKWIPETNAAIAPQKVVGAAYITWEGDYSEVANFAKDGWGKQTTQTAQAPGGGTNPTIPGGSLSSQPQPSPSPEPKKRCDHKTSAPAKPDALRQCHRSKPNQESITATITATETGGASAKGDGETTPTLSLNPGKDLTIAWNLENTDDVADDTQFITLAHDSSGAVLDIFDAVTFTKTTLKDNNKATLTTIREGQSVVASLTTFSVGFKDGDKTAIKDSALAAVKVEPKETTTQGEFSFVKPTIDAGDTFAPFQWKYPDIDKDPLRSLEYAPQAAEPQWKTPEITDDSGTTWKTPDIATETVFKPAQSAIPVPEKEGDTTYQFRGTTKSGKKVIGTAKLTKKGAVKAGIKISPRVKSWQLVTAGGTPQEFKKGLPGVTVSLIDTATKLPVCKATSVGEIATLQATADGCQKMQAGKKYQVQFDLNVTQTGNYFVDLAGGVTASATNPNVFTANEQVEAVIDANGNYPLKNLDFLVRPVLMGTLRLTNGQSLNNVETCAYFGTKPGIRKFFDQLSKKPGCSQGTLGIPSVYTAPSQNGVYNIYLSAASLKASNGVVTLDNFDRRYKLSPKQNLSVTGMSLQKPFAIVNATMQQ